MRMDLLILLKLQKTIILYKNERKIVDLDGTYLFNGKTLVIQGEALYHEETDKHYTNQQRNNICISINRQIISEISSYRF